MGERARYPESVPGDFYVEEGCCLNCEVPTSVAPELFGMGDTHGMSHCFVKRQPRTPAELDRMVEAIRVADLDCIRYAAADPMMLIRLAATGCHSSCDQLPAEFEHLAGRQLAERRWKGQLDAAEESTPGERRPAGVGGTGGPGGEIAATRRIKSIVMSSRLLHSYLPRH